MTIEGVQAHAGRAPVSSHLGRIRAAMKRMTQCAVLVGIGILIALAGVHYSMLPPVLQVPASAETETFPISGDMVDDPSLWVDPNDPEQSLVIASVKRFGLVVYDLNGRLVQSLVDGDINNVDIRQDVFLSGEPMTLIAASRRDTNSIEFYTIDAASHRVVKLAQTDLITHNEIYGICLHHDRKTDYISVFVTGHTGVVEQWMIFQGRSGLISGHKVRKIKLHTVAEGCVADDELGRLYLSEENHGIVWFHTDPTRGARKHWVDRIVTGVLRQDVEGLTLYKTGRETGYLLASSQGNSTIVMYDRMDNHLLGRFHVSENPAANVDEVTDTDGIVAVSSSLGRRYPSGLLVVQDGEDDVPRNRQNFKFVSFLDIIRALDPRQGGRAG